METRKKRIGFVIGNYHTDHPSRLVYTIWELLRDEDVELQVFLGTESASFMKDFVMRSNLFDYQYASLCGYSEYEKLDVLIVSAGTLSIYQNEIPLEEFLRHTPNIPTILMETDHVHGDGISLIADNRQGLASCVEHLITVHGMRRIGFVSGPKNNRDAEERFAGYRDMLRKYEIPFREEYVAQGDYSEHVDESVEQLLDRAPELEAIVSANDEMAVSIYRVLGRRNLVVGKDIAVTGFDDMLMARYMDPPLTTARQDYDAFSHAAVDSALKMLRGEKAFSKRIPVPFIRRCSCGCEKAPDLEEQPMSPGQEELLKNMQRSREYQLNSWIGSLLNREMLLEVDDPKQFFTSLGSFMAYLGTPASYLCLFEHPLMVKRGTIPDFPEKIFVCMRQRGQEYEGYDWDEAPVLYRNNPSEVTPYGAMASGMTFLLFDEEYQYGVLNAMIEPDKIDFCYMLSLDIGTSLRYMDLWAQQKRYRAELQALARTDALTGLNNRAGVIHERAQMIGRRSRRAGVILADLDHLKQINDRFGHQAGDMALKAAADILREAVREAGAGSFQPGQGNDTNAESFQPHPENGGARVQENDKNAEGAPRQILGRFGGDEFISYCVDMTSEQIAAQLTRIRELCDRFNESSDLPYYVEISAGFAVGKVRRTEDWEKLVERADAQLYEAKKTRREFVVRGRQP